MNQNVLTICPSRKRPELLMEMMASYVATRSPGNHLMVYISPDDPEYYRYIATLPWPENCWLITGPRQYISQTYNILSFSNLQYEYFAPINDDHFFITPEWDEKLIKLLDEKSHGWGCAMADDKLTDWSKHTHPSGCIISRKTIQVLEYMFYPKLHHIGNDVIMGKLFGDLGILHGTKDVVIEHRHWVNGMRGFDDNYKWVYGQEEQSYGDNMIAEYLYNQYQIDKHKILAAMKKDNK